MIQTRIAGNWKMQGTFAFAKQYFDVLLPLLSESSKTAYLAVPHTLLAFSSSLARNSSLVIGAQNMSERDEGAVTGEIAAAMLFDAGAKFVLIGHSERRHLLGETEAMIGKKVAKALESGIEPFLCVGETGEERKEGNEYSILERQLDSAFSEVSSALAEKVTIAYEPVWAIGTGIHADPEVAEGMHGYIREWVIRRFGEEKGRKIPLLYGGSVKSANVQGFLEQEHINGALVGGASLDPAEFFRIIQFS